jgi:hypothetical protein
MRLRHHLMAKPPTPDTIALTVRERVLLFCAGSGTDWKRAGVTSETVIDMIEKGLIVDHPLDWLALTMRGRAVLKGHGAVLREVTGRSLSALMFGL